MAIESGFDCHELDDLGRLMYKTAGDVYPKQAKDFLKEQGNKGAQLLKDETRAAIKGHRVRATPEEKKKSLLRGIRRGSPQKYEGDWQIRVKSKAYHAHLIEYGHVLIPWGHQPKSEIFLPGLYPKDMALGQLDAQLPSAAAKFVDELIKEGFEL